VYPSPAFVRALGLLDEGIDLMDEDRPASTRMIVSEEWNGTRPSPGMAGTTGRDPTATTICSAVICSPPTASTRGGPDCGITVNGP
jgi:hypothetical protein